MSSQREIRLQGVHTYVHPPVLPFKLRAKEFEAHALRLSDVQRLQVLAELEVFLGGGHEIREEVEGLAGRRDALAFRVCELIFR